MIQKNLPYLVVSTAIATVAVGSFAIGYTVADLVIRCCYPERTR